MTSPRDRLLGAARADLTALPDLVEELTRLIADRHHDTGHHHKVTGSPAPLQLPVVHLTDTRHKPRWRTADPESDQVFERYGISPGLETWVRKLAFALPEWPDLTEQPTVRSECAVLVEHWDFICAQDWGETLARQVRDVMAQVKAALGIPKDPRYRCPECGNPAYLVPGGILSCQEGHERVVRNLEQQLRRRPIATTTEIVEEFTDQGVTAGLLRQWKLRRRITPARTERGHNWWWPWDVFCLLNPDIAEAVRRRDETATADPETA